MFCGTTRCSNKRSIGFFGSAVPNTQCTSGGPKVSTRVQFSRLLPSLERFLKSSAYRYGSSGCRREPAQLVRLSSEGQALLFKRVQRCGEPIRGRPGLRFKMRISLHHDVGSLKSLLPCNLEGRLQTELIGEIPGLEFCLHCRVIVAADHVQREKQNFTLRPHQILNESIKSLNRALRKYGQPLLPERISLLRIKHRP